MNQDQWLRKAIKKIIQEQEQKNSKKKSSSAGSKVFYVSGAIGRGRVSDQIKSMKALALSNPRQLMKNLGVKEPSGDDLQKVENILTSAFSNDETMKSVYNISQKRTINVKDQQTTGYEVDISIIKPRDALNYVLHTLLGAEKAFNLKFDGEIMVNRLGNKLVVYVNE